VPVRQALVVSLLAALALPATAFARVDAGSPAPLYGFQTRAAQQAVAARLSQASGFTGGPVTASDGEQVTVYVDDTLAAADPTIGQRWADIVAGLVHGPEISTVQIYVASLPQVQQTCGRGALGCYGGNRLITIADDAAGITAQAVLTHEYGHHVAQSRDNSPWPSVDYGPKRWSTVVGVCSRAASGELAPGDEGVRYTLNPGEAFAEDYRVLNERREGIPETAWGVVDPRFYPDQAALDAVALDVTSPWTGPTSAAIHSSLTPHGTGRGFPVSTPLDGTFSVTLLSPRKSRFTLRLVDPATKKELASLSGPDTTKTLQANVCGQRTIQVQVKRVAGSGPFTLTVSEP